MMNHKDQYTPFHEDGSGELECHHCGDRHKGTLREASQGRFDCKECGHRNFFVGVKDGTECVGYSMISARPLRDGELDVFDSGCCRYVSVEDLQRYGAREAFLLSKSPGAYSGDHYTREDLEGILAGG